MNENRQKYRFAKILLRIMPICHRSVPWHSAINNVLGLIHGASFALSVAATQRLFDTVADAAKGMAGFMDCLFSLLVLAGITFGQQILNGAHNFHVDVMCRKSSGKVLGILHQKLRRVDPASFEDTGFLDDLNKAVEGAKVLPYFSSILSIVLVFYGVYFAAVGAYLFSLKPILLIILLLAFVPAMFAQIVRAKVFTKLEEESAPLRREHEHYRNILCDREYFKETRLLGAYNFFHKLFSETLRLLTRKTWRAERKTALLQLSFNVVSFLGMAAASYLLFTATMAGEVTVGTFAAVFSALSMVFGIMEEVIGMHIGNINKDIGKVANFIRILDLPERTGASGEADFSKGVTAKNISFTYPGRGEPAVKEVSMTIADGETVAIVGENGAGKSTLVRLLTGVYRPSKGAVAVGGLDTADTAPECIFRDISGVFQTYQRYKMTLRDNVTISDAGAAAEDARIEAALEKADAAREIELGAMLSPEFDGVDLSGGEWQRVAITRGLYREHGFIALDEPTSAIDPIEETLIYEKFQQLAKGKCAVLVTHRLGSVKLAHRIVVMDKGEIVDTGTHDELLARPGKYADMWAAQAEWYERRLD